MNPQTVMLATYVDSETAERLRKLAKDENRSVAFMLRAAVTLLLAQTTKGR